MIDRQSHLFIHAAGSDYTANDPAPEANSNLRWKTRNAVPNREFTVDIHADDVPEPVEYLEVVLNCDGNENCYIPRSVYRITIIDNQGRFSAVVCHYIYVVANISLH